MGIELSDYQRLEKAAWEANVTITKLCQAAGVSRGAVTNWKTGRSSPTLKAYNKMLDAAADLKKKNNFIQQLPQ